MIKNILVLGGTQFVGRHFTRLLGAEPNVNLTLFHRGKTNPGLYPEYQHILGNRDTQDIQQITNQDWDVVIDFCAYYPQPLRDLTTALSGRVGRYILISTVSVYDLENFEAGEWISETSQTVSCSESEETDTGMLTYGKRKVACEAVLEGHPELKPVIFRPGLIYGPYDPTDRAYYWLWRVQRQQPFLITEPQLRHQWTYARDFARILVQATLGPQPTHPLYLALTHDPLNFQAILETMAQACGQKTLPYQVVSSQWMEENKLNYWQDLPLSLPFERCFERQRLQTDFPLDKTSFSQSWSETHDYYAALNWPKPQTGLRPEQEDNYLAELA